MNRHHITVPKIEFKSITSGLQKSRSEQLTQPKLKKRIKYVSSPTQEDDKRHQWDMSHGMQKSIKYSILNKNVLPSAEFQLIPKVPITLMNSTMNNKRIQSLILVKSKKQVLEHQVDHSIQSNSVQDNAVREMLDQYHTQFNFKSATENKKRRLVQDLKDQYMKEMFIKNQKIEQNEHYHYFETQTNQSINGKKKFQSQELPVCGGFCDYIHHLQQRRQQFGYITSYV